ncbi:MAG: transcriptional regulator [Flavobacterium sp.]|nr:MAG: transcriptional regulator [Flavobacterium sp.]
MRKANSTNYENQKKLEESCGLTYAMILLSGRWKVNILWNINNGINRYGRLKNGIPGISEKMLTQRLRDMENEGLIIRKDFNKVPPHVEYYLTESSKQLTPILDKLCNWGSQVRPMLMELEKQLTAD